VFRDHELLRHLSVEVDGRQGGAAVEPADTHRLQAGEVLKQYTDVKGTVTEPVATHLLEA
jgi:hypothetical protein